MEKEISCPACGVKTYESYNYCPHCAYGLLVTSRQHKVDDDLLFVQVKGRLSSLEERSIELQQRLDSFILVSRISTK